MVNFGPLTAEIGAVVWGHHSKFQRVSHLGIVTAAKPTKLCTVFGRLLGWYSTVAWSVGLSVFLSVILVSLAKTAEPIEMSFGLWALMGPRNHVLDGVQIIRGKAQLLGKSICPGKPVDTLPCAVQK